MMRSKINALLRSAEARSADELQSAIARDLRAVSAEDARGWFAACGYSII